ncbi:hypothetical protein OESDEN_04153 [Oesophagostomum dentatum]|uniref:G-protein coupled receptors family 1 profile domain-containing protein n=1 Tax=Oesophagostomum dentatum TaxID=61180 RepID=A0A0B1TF41_OESDE|nr:hypothetical protein OESDEN_04153 [Oesophagostomum dentatum]
MLAAFSFGNVVAGIAFFLTGLSRVKRLLEGTYFTTTTSLECISTDGSPILMIVGGQFPALINTCIAAERIIAFRFPSWYRRRWNNYSRCSLVLLSAVSCAIFIATVICINIKQIRILEDRKCGVFLSAGALYATVSYSLIALSYIISYVLLLAIFREKSKIRVSFAVIVLAFNSVKPLLF